jgi:hypothetical protein
MSLLYELGQFSLIYVSAAVLAHILHLSVGVLSVGRREVGRQVVEVYEAIGPVCYGLFVLSAGFLPRNKPEVET